LVRKIAFDVAWVYCIATLVKAIAAVAKIAKATITSNSVKPEARLSRVTLDLRGVASQESPKAVLEEQR
jgi:hypothetical protein